MSALLFEIACWSLCILLDAPWHDPSTLVYVALLAAALLRAPGVALEDEEHAERVRRSEDAWERILRNAKSPPERTP